MTSIWTCTASCLDLGGIPIIIVDPVDYEVPSGGAALPTPLSLPATDGTGGTDAVEHAAWYCVVPIIVVASLGLGITV